MAAEAVYVSIFVALRVGILRVVAGLPFVLASERYGLQLRRGVEAEVVQFQKRLS